MQGSYAVAGGAAFSAGVTRAVSTAVFVFEMTGQLHQLVPVLCASLSLSSPMMACDAACFRINVRIECDAGSGLIGVRVVFCQGCR